MVPGWSRSKAAATRPPRWARSNARPRRGRREQPARVYDVERGGKPVLEIDVSSALGLEHPAGAESDLEGSTRVGDRAYFLSSHARTSKGKRDPDRLLFFATKLPSERRADRARHVSLAARGLDERATPRSLRAPRGRGARTEGTWWPQPGRVDSSRRGRSLARLPEPRARRARVARRVAQPRRGGRRKEGSVLGPGAARSGRARDSRAQSLEVEHPGFGGAERRRGTLQALSVEREPGRADRRGPLGVRRGGHFRR